MGFERTLRAIIGAANVISVPIAGVHFLPCSAAVRRNCAAREAGRFHEGGAAGGAGSQPRAAAKPARRRRAGDSDREI